MTQCWAHLLFGLRWRISAPAARDGAARRRARCGPTRNRAAAQALNWLRYGCVPVGVLEGRAPPEKRALQQQRRAAGPHPEWLGLGLGLPYGAIVCGG